MGPSGLGKTTLLRYINMLEDYEAGEITVVGHPVRYRVAANGRRISRSETESARARAEIGFVFQNFNLFPHLAELHNVTAAPDRVKGIPRRPAEKRVRAFGLDGIEREGGCISDQFVRRAAAAGRDRARLGHGAEAHAIRRSDVGAGSRTGR